MDDRKYKNLGELLVELNYLSEEKLNEALEKHVNSDQSLPEFLIDYDYISEEDLIYVMEIQLGVERANMSDYSYNPELKEYIPENIARHYSAVPLIKEDDKLKVAMAEPNDIIAIDDMEMASNLKIEPLIANRAEIKRAQGQVYSDFEDDTDDLFSSLSSYREKEEDDIDELQKMVEEAPIVRLANIIINQALQADASDIHIEPLTNEVQIRYRVDGVLREHMVVPKYSQAALVSRIKIMADMDITKRDIPQDGRIRQKLNGITVDMRISTLPTVHGESVVIRLLSKDEKLLNIDKLGFNKDNLSKFKALINNPHGILLVTGPTGSGKSTTLFAVLNQLNTVEEKIITIEDPVEYQLKGINQVQVNNRKNMTFARALRSILRQDPDIIMVGEMRDKETAQIAVRAALTGHLVLSTLHTNDSSSSITRLMDMGIPSYLVASTIKGIVAQRLVRRLCTNCKQGYQPGIEEKEILNIEGERTLYKAEGCENCGFTGYKGRLAIQEVLMIDEEIEEMIIKEKSKQEIKNAALSKGMITLKGDVRDKVLKGLTSYNEMVRVIV